MRRISASLMALAVVFSPLLSAPAAGQSEAALASRDAIWNYAPELRAPTDAELDQMRSRWRRMGAEMEAGQWPAFYDLAEADFTQKQATYGPGHPLTGMAANMMAMASLNLGRNDEAYDWANEAVRILEAALPPDDIALAVVYGQLAEAQWQLGLMPQAERSLRHSNDIAWTNGDQNLELSSRGMLIDLLEEQGRFAEADALRRGEVE